MVAMRKLTIISFVLLFSFSLLTACRTGQPTPIQEDRQTTTPEDVQNTTPLDEYEKGTFTETEYESKYLDLRFELPDGFLMATEDDIREMTGLGAEIMDLDSNVVEYAKLT